MAVYRPTYTDKKTGEKRQSKTWWFEFILAGQRVRESAKTTRKTLAVEAEKQRRREVEAAYNGVARDEFKHLRVQSVRAALAAYRAGYGVNHRKASIDLVRYRSMPLDRHLGGLLASQLTEDRIKAYMLDRREEGAGNRTINLELGVLARALGRKVQTMWPKLRRLEENHDVGRALSHDEEQRIVDAAAKSRSRMIGTVVSIALMTGMRRDEIRLLRWSQIDLEQRNITVGQQAKTNAGRGRVIPYGARLASILSTYIDWYTGKLGPLQPHWYAFPLSNRIKPVDPEQPIGSIKRAWESVRASAGVSCRFHDLRHTVCTKMAEAGVPEATMKAIMGHMTAAMLERYSHIRQASKQDAMQAVEDRSFFAPLQESPKVRDSNGSKIPVSH